MKITEEIGLGLRLPLFTPKKLSSTNVVAALLVAGEKWDSVEKVGDVVYFCYYNFEEAQRLIDKHFAGSQATTTFDYCAALAVVRREMFELKNRD